MSAHNAAAGGLQVDAPLLRGALAGAAFLAFATLAHAQPSGRAAPAQPPLHPAASVPAPAAAAAPMSRAGMVNSAPAVGGFERQEIRAQLLPRRYTTVAAEIGAKVNRLPIPEGGSFRAGQLLVGFDCTLQVAQTEKAQAELEGAASTLKANQRLAELNSVGQLDLELSRSAATKARAEVGANQAVLSKCNVAAPFAGRVAEQRVREQQYVQAGQPLLDIIDDSVLELEFLVPSRWLAWLRPGVPFEVTIDETGKTYPAKFTRIGARVDPVSQSVKVAAAVAGRFPELMAGMSGRIQVKQP